MAPETFDYIIVGSGSAGAVVANRLSADPNVRVLLLEAGGSDKDFAQLQLLDMGSLFAAWGPSTDWGFVSENVPGLNSRPMPITQGKVLGGGSSVNGRIYLRGDQRDFNHWNYLGNEGWSYRDVLPYFKKSEDFLGGEDEYHGVGGPITVMQQNNPSPASQLFVESAIEVLGGRGPVDLNAPGRENVAGFVPHTTTRDMLRCSVALGYIYPIMDRPNFTLKLEALVSRLLIENGRAVGVEYLKGGQLHQARAEAEVVLSAGPFGSPKILMLSGLGPAAHLRQHGIEVVADLAGVGQNLQDHLLARMAWVSEKEQPAPIMIAEATAFTYTRTGIEQASPDIQYLFSPFLFPNPDYNGPGFTMVPALQQAKSTGSVGLRSSDPVDAPLIQPNYLAADIDLQNLVDGLKLGRELIGSHAFDGTRGRELLPGPGLKSDDELREYVRNTCITEWHPACTCKMGRDATAVVDPQLRVHGIDALRVIDVSIMPRIVNANLMASALMIGEKGADLLKESQA